MKKKCLD